MLSKRAIRMCLIATGLACAAGFSSIAATHQSESARLDLVSLHQQRDALAATVSSTGPDKINVYFAGAGDMRRLNQAGASRPAL